MWCVLPFRGATSRLTWFISPFFSLEYLTYIFRADAIVRSLQDSLAVLSSELIPIHEKLVTLRRQLVALAAKEGSHKSELKPIQEELRKIDSKRVDGKFLGTGGVIPASQAICSSLLEECFEISQEIKAQEESKHVATSLKPIYDRLGEIRAELENLVLTHRWSLRETDLWNYSVSLQEIDKMRVDGKFVDQEGNRPSGQYVCRPHHDYLEPKALTARDRCFYIY